MSVSPTVLVLGAQGALGRLCVDALTRAGMTVVRGGRRPDPAADFRLVDLDRPETIRSAVAEADLVVSTVRHPSLAAERVVMQDGGALLSVAGLNADDRRQLKADPCDGLVVVHAGLVPGVYTLVLAELLERHPRADGMQIAWAVSAFGTSGPAVATDFMRPAVGGRGRLPTQVMEFGAPIGPRRCLQVAGGQIGLFGELDADREGEVHLCFQERPVQAHLLAMNAVGLLSRVPAGFFRVGRRWTRSRMTTEPKRDVLSVRRGGEILASCRVEGSGDYLMTAGATVCFAEALLQRRAADPSLQGVFGAEELLTFDELRPAFERHDIRFVSDSL